MEEGKWEKIGPKRAEEYINLNTNNRSLRPGVAERYADDMRNGKWLRNPQPIMFFEDGSLADGQHRLWAVIESGKTIDFFVVRDVKKDVALNIDTGIARTLTDNVRLAGLAPVSAFAVAIARMMHHGTRSAGAASSNAAKLELVNRYAGHIAWVEAHIPKKRTMGTAIVGAALGRSHMHEKDMDRLRAFCEVLGSGMMASPEDSAAVALRNYLLEIAHDRKVDSRDMFLKAMNAVKYFMRKKPLTMIKSVKDEAYPLKGK